MPLYRAGEITYYEELGVDRDASPEEIRNFFAPWFAFSTPTNKRIDT